MAVDQQKNMTMVSLDTYTFGTIKTYEASYELIPKEHRIIVMNTSLISSEGVYEQFVSLKFFNKDTYHQKTKKIRVFIRIEVEE